MKNDMAEQFEHKSLKQRLDECNGRIDVYEYEWMDLVEGEYFNNISDAIQGIFEYD